MSVLPGAELPSPACVVDGLGAVQAESIQSEAVDKKDTESINVIRATRDAGRGHFLQFCLQSAGVVRGIPPMCCRVWPKAVVLL